MKNKPELIGFSDFLMVAPFFDLRSFFRPEIEFLKGGHEALLASGEINDDQNELIEYHDNVAVLTIEGPLRPGRDWWFATGYGDIRDAVDELIKNQRITTVIQEIDSPGGTVKEAFETEKKFRELAEKKKLISLITGSATSGAALMTFPAEKRYLASKTAQTGSIGVVSQHIDDREWYKMFGEVRTSIAKGDFKDAGTNVRAYDEKAKIVFEDVVSKLYDIFADSAAVGLGLSREKIDEMESRVYIGQDGIDKGFADGFSTLPELIEKYNISSPSGIPAFLEHIEVKSMNAEKLETDFPKEIASIRKTAHELGKIEGKAEHAGDMESGIKSERKRALDIRALSQPGCEPLIEQMINDGILANEAARIILTHITEKRELSKKNIETGLNHAISTDAPETPENSNKPADISKMSDEEKMKKAWEMNTDFHSESSMKVYFKENPEELEEFLQGGK